MPGLRVQSKNRDWQAGCRNWHRWIEKKSSKESFDSSCRCVENAGDEVTIAVREGLTAAKAHEKEGPFAARSRRRSSPTPAGGRANLDILPALSRKRLPLARKGRRFLRLLSQLRRVPASSGGLTAPSLHRQ